MSQNNAPFRVRVTCTVSSCQNFARLTIYFTRSLKGRYFTVWIGQWRTGGSVYSKDKLFTYLCWSYRFLMVSTRSKHTTVISSLHLFWYESRGKGPEEIRLPVPFFVRRWEMVWYQSKTFLSIVWAVLLLRLFVEGSQFIIPADHHVLRWILFLKD